MIVKGITGQQLSDALGVANVEYAGNLRLEGNLYGTPNGIRFTLKVSDSRAYGARTSASGRHIPSASWEAHRDLFRAIFAINPHTVIRTALATYRGSEDFEKSFPSTAFAPVGTIVAPGNFRDLTIFKKGA